MKGKVLVGHVNSQPVGLGYVMLRTVNSRSQIASTSASNCKLTGVYNLTSVCVPEHYWARLYGLSLG
jgi:hypothetical protein